MMLSDRSPFPRSFYFKVSWMMALVKEKFFKFTIVSLMLALHSLCKFGKEISMGSAFLWLKDGGDGLSAGR